MLHFIKGQSPSKVKAIENIQLNIEEQLNKKMFYIQLHKEDIERVHLLSSILDEYASHIARRHYDMICQMPETKAIMDQHSYEQKFLATYEKYVRSIGEFEPNEQYVYNRKMIGKVHARIQLTSEWFVASYVRFYEVLVPVIMQKLGRSKGSAALVSLQKLLSLDSQIALEAYQEAHEFKFVETNSEIIESLIEIDEVGELLDSVDYSMDAATNISSAAEQLAASIQEIAKHAITVAENSDEMVDSARQGQHTIQEALNGISLLVEEMRELRKKFTNLNESVAQMTDVASFINEIADQTSLLALNAAIEAARAGEEGRGFAVVANEVRKLSEQTSRSVGQIQGMIESVQATANQVDGMTVAMEYNMLEKGETAHTAVSQLEGIIAGMVDMGSRTSNIAAIIEEQTAATDDIASRTNDLLMHIAIIKRNATGTGQKIYDVSYKVNKLRNETLRYMGKLSDDYMVRIVKTDHLLWRWWVYNSILGYHTLDAKKAGDADACRLGKWYSKVSTQGKFNQNEAFRKIDAPHRDIHKMVGTVASYIESNDRAAAIEQLKQIEDTSGQVVESLDNLYVSMSSKR